MLFGKKKKDQDTSEDTEERSIKLKSKPLDEKEKRVKRKPWGKKERYVVFALVFSTACISFFLAFVARKGKLPGFPRIDAPSLGLEQTVVFTKSQVPADRKEKEDKIVSDFVARTQNLSGIYALVVVDLTSGDTFGVNMNEKMQAASLIKLPTMALLLKEASEGKINLNANYTLQDNDKIGGSGSLYGKPAGTKLTYKTLLEYMGKQSDNTAFNIVKKTLTVPEIESFMDEIGMTHTDVDSNMTSPGDIALLLRKLYEGRIVEPQWANMLFDAITDTIYEKHLRAGVPEEVQVAHKYGREVHVVNDAGVVFMKRPYVAVIMTDGVVETEADELFPTLSKIVYDGQSD